jgi:hypothetical protein
MRYPVWMKNRYLRIGKVCSTLFLVGTAACLITAPASAADCSFPDKRTIDVRIQRMDGQIAVNNEYSRDNLRQMQRQSGRANAFGSAWTPVGLTLTELKYQMRLQIEALPMPSGRYCARLTAVNAELGYDKLSVFIARKFRPGSCAYNSIKSHEMTHVAVFQQALDEFFPRLQHRLERAAGQLQPIQSASPDLAASYLRQRLGASVQSLFLEMNRTLDRNNARLDTPERYKQEQALCKDW